MARGALVLALMGFALKAIGCGTNETPGSVDAAPPPSDAAGSAAVDASGGAGDAGEDADSGDASAADASSADGSASGLPGTSEGCPDDMVLVHGEYCPSSEQECIEHHEEYKRDLERKKKKEESGEEVSASTVSERCLRYKEPSVCTSKKLEPMRFCVDRYEWPNKKGELPMLLISWTEAKKTCESIGKRLCTENEFNFACEGPEMLPYTYGYARDPNKCNIDKEYRKRKRKLSKYERCLKKPQCKAELERLDQRRPAGSMPECVSPFGVYDMNGNINEWVFRPGKERPNRSGLKGGWWGPVRGRCRPTVGFHKEEDYGYEEGFRCCKDAEP